MNTNQPAGLPTEPELPTWEPGQKRTFPEDFKRRAVAYYNSLPEDGFKGSYLRRAGIYSSSMSQWRRAVQVDTPSKAGRPPTDRVVRENGELEVRVAKLEAELARANAASRSGASAGAFVLNLSPPPGSR